MGTKLKRWQPWEIDFVRENFPTKGGLHCARHLERTPIAVGHKANRLKVHIVPREAKVRSSLTNARLPRPIASIEAWKKAVKRRDNYTCQRCDLREPLIVTAHHKVPRSQGGAAYDLSNGETLCPNCHAMEHALSGRSWAAQRLTIDEIKTVRMLRAQGMTIDRISTTTGISHKSVFKVIKTD